MKSMILILVLLLSVSLLAGCVATTNEVLPGQLPSYNAAPQETSTTRPAEAPTPTIENQDDDMLRISIAVGNMVFKAQLLDSELTRRLVEQLPLTLEMSDHAGQEKVAPLPFELPAAEVENPDMIRAGELYLWSGNQFVLFYESFTNHYDGYVRLGEIEDVDGLAEAVGSGDVTVTITMDAGIHTQTTNQAEDNTLVAYFSCTSNTEQIAGLIAQHTGADLFLIIPEEPYTSEDLDYGDSSSRSSTEQNDAAARPVIAGTVEGMDKYDIVFLGYPIWFGQAPKIISTFLESYDFSGKTIVPFCTSGSSGIGSSDTNLYNLTSDSTSWLPGERFSAGESLDTVAQWIDGLDI